MHQSSFKKISAVAILFFFLATPTGAFAQDTFPASDVFPNAQPAPFRDVIDNASPNCPGGVCTPPSLGSGGLSSLLGSGGSQGGLDPMSFLGGMFGGLLSGRGGFGGGAGFGGGGGGGAGGQVGQVLTLVGALTGNMGLLMAGMITSMLGSLGGSTPQTGNVDEQYVSQGQSYGSGGSGMYSPYYPTPTPAPSTGSGQVASACSATIFIVKDTTVTPNVTKPYPSTTSVAQNNCVLAINTDTVKQAVTIQPTSQTSGSALGITEVAPGASHIFRFSTKNTYKFCISPSACSTVTVQ